MHNANRENGKRLDSKPHRKQGLIGPLALMRNVLGTPFAFGTDARFRLLRQSAKSFEIIRPKVLLVCVKWGNNEQKEHE
jgi:hypothetical protein